MLMVKMLHLNNPSLITNFRCSERSRYEKAIQVCREQGNDYGLYIVDKAYDNCGRIISDCNALKIKDRYIGSLSKFWEIYKNIS
jgi:hypothetical protein